jgi:hypothetical protein
LQGSSVLNTTLEVGSRRIGTIDISNLTSGMYIVTLKSATLNTSHKIIKE